MSTTTAALMDSSFWNWLLQTRTTFYDDSELELPWWFGLGCWNYALAGACLLWTPEPSWVSQRGFPYKTVAWLLMAVQAPLSFLADYVHMTQDSYWHVVDRCLALPLTLAEVSRFGLSAHHSLSNNRDQPGATMAGSLLGLNLLALLLALLAFLQSTNAQTQLDREGFIFWHTVWHLYPLAASAITSYDFYAGGGWKRSNRKYFYQLEWHLLKKVD